MSRFRVYKVWPALLGALAGALAGCAQSSDACQGRTETCVSLTLSGSDSVTQVDQLEAVVMRQALSQMPIMPLNVAQTLPFKVAVLWPDGPGTLSIRSFLAGQLNGVTPELALDLSHGSHAQYALTLYPPLVGSPLGDMWLPPMDMAVPDMTTVAPDMTTTAPDMTTRPPDMTIRPPDMSNDGPADLLPTTD